jgi:hypothetical protein
MDEQTPMKLGKNSQQQKELKQYEKRLREKMDVNKYNKNMVHDIHRHIFR